LGFQHQRTFVDRGRQAKINTKTQKHPPAPTITPTPRPHPHQVHNTQLNTQLLTSSAQLMAKRKREVPRVLNRATISPKQRKNTDILAKQGWVLLKMREKDKRFLKAMQIPLERATYVGSNGTENGEKDKQPAALGVDGGGSGNASTEVSQQLDYETIRDKWAKSNKRYPFELPPTVKTTKTTGEWDLSGLNQTKKMQFGKAFHQTGNDRTGRTLLEQGIEHVVEVALRDTMGKFLVDQLVPFHHLATPQVARTDQEKQKIAALPALSLQQTLIIKYEYEENWAVATSLETLIAQCLEVQVADVHVAAPHFFASETSGEVTYSVGLQNLCPDKVRAVEQKMDKLKRKLKTQVYSSGRVSDASTPVLSINALKNMGAGDIKAWLETYLDQDLHRDYCDALTVLVTTACPARLAIVKGSHTNTGGPGKPFAASVVDHPDQHEYHIITLPAYSVLVVNR
jgi:hypothetical protein